MNTAFDMVRGKYPKLPKNCRNTPQKTVRKCPLSENCRKMSEKCAKSHKTSPNAAKSQKTPQMPEYIKKLPKNAEQLVSPVINRKIKTLIKYVLLFSFYWFYIIKFVICVFI